MLVLGHCDLNREAPAREVERDAGAGGRWAAGVRTLPATNNRSWGLRALAEIVANHNHCFSGPD